MAATTLVVLAFLLGTVQPKCARLPRGESACNSVNNKIEIISNFKLHAACLCMLKIVIPLLALATAILWLTFGSKLWQTQTPSLSCVSETMSSHEQLRWQRGHYTWMAYATLPGHHAFSISLSKASSLCGVAYCAYINPSFHVLQYTYK